MRVSLIRMRMEVFNSSLEQYHGEACATPVIERYRHLCFDVVTLFYN